MPHLPGSALSPGRRGAAPGAHVGHRGRVTAGTPRPRPVGNAGAVPLQSRAAHRSSRIPDPHTLPAGGAERTGGRDCADSGVNPPRARRCSPAGRPSRRRGGGAGSAGSVTRGGGGTRTGAGAGPGLRPPAQRGPRAAQQPISAALADSQSARGVLGAVAMGTARRHARAAACAVSGA